jgi:hypothetical protein
LQPVPARHPVPPSPGKASIDAPSLSARLVAGLALAAAFVLAGAGTALAGPPSGGAAAGDGAPAVRPGAARALLEQIAACESGGDPSAVSRDGRHRGKYQFSIDTWRALGGRGDPADASEALQDRLALELYRREGTAPWPTCGRAAVAALD